MKKLIFSLLMGLYASGSYAQQLIVTTYAGSGIAGYGGDWGSATAARLSNPVSVAVDKAGNLFIAEQGNNIIRKVSPEGVISTVAGNGSIGYSGDGAAGIAAKLNAPGAIAIDTFGNIFIADAGNCVIRKLNAAGIISTIAGNDTAGCGYSGDGGPAILARMRAPNGLTIDAGGNLIIADQGNEVVRKINAAGIISTIAGNDSAGFLGDGGPATSAEFNFPVQLAADASGGIYIADLNNGRIRKINGAGIITTVAGNSISGTFADGIPATAARLVAPTSVAIDRNDNLIIPDLGINQLRKVNTAGIISTIAGSGVLGYGGDNGPATACKFDHPFGITTDKNGNIFVADRDNNVVRKISPVVSGITQIAATDRNIILSPNPNNNGIFTISGTFNSIPGEKVTITVTDIFGRVVYTNTFTAKNGKLNTQIIMDNGLSVGQYLVHIRSENEDVLRLVIEK